MIRVAAVLTLVLPCSVSDEVFERPDGGGGLDVGGAEPPADAPNEGAGDHPDAPVDSDAPDSDEPDGPGDRSETGSGSDVPPAAKGWSWGGGSAYASGAEDVALDAAGNLYVVGWFEGVLSIGGKKLASVGSARDGFVTKLDTNGDVVWLVALAGVDHDNLTGVTIDGGLLTVTGSVASTAKIGGFSWMGGGTNLIWAQLKAEDGAAERLAGLHGGDSWAHAIARGSDGRLAIAGSFEGEIDELAGEAPAGGQADALVMVLSADGALEFGRSLRGPFMDRALDLTWTPSGDIVTVGFFERSLVWDEGEVIGADAGGYDGFVASLSGTNGKVSWLNTLVSSAEDYIPTVGVAPDGAIAIAGHHAKSAVFAGDPVEGKRGINGFAAVLDGDGGLRWWHPFGGDSFFDAATWNGDSWLVVGRHHETFDPGVGMDLTKGLLTTWLSPDDGALLDAVGYAPGPEVATAAVGPSGETAMAGAYSASVDLGFGFLPTTASGGAAFIVKKEK